MIIPDGLGWVAKIAEVWDPRISRISFFWSVCHDSEFEDLLLLPLDVHVQVPVQGVQSVLVNASRKHAQVDRDVFSEEFVEKKKKENLPCV